MILLIWILILTFIDTLCSVEEKQPKKNNNTTAAAAPAPTPTPAANNSKTTTTAVAAPPPPPPSNSIIDEAVAAADLDKKKKALNKKLKQIDELKIKQANGESLNSEQLNKIATENDLRQELANLTI